MSSKKFKPPRAYCQGTGSSTLPSSPTFFLIAPHRIPQAKIIRPYLCRFFRSISDIPPFYSFPPFYFFPAIPGPASCPAGRPQTAPRPLYPPPLRWPAFPGHSFWGSVGSLCEVPTNGRKQNCDQKVKRVKNGLIKCGRNGFDPSVHTYLHPLIVSCFFLYSCFATQKNQMPARKSPMEPSRAGAVFRKS